MEDQEGEIRIYVACLAAYNNGIQHGCWIDATDNEEDIRERIRDMLFASPILGAQEWAIHDHEGFEGAPIGESMPIDTICQIAAFIELHGALGGKLLDYCDDVNDAREAIQDRYYGEYKCVEDFMEEFIEEHHRVPNEVRYYIDYSTMARDWQVNDIFVIETGFQAVHVFLWP